MENNDLRNLLLQYPGITVNKIDNNKLHLKGIVKIENTWCIFVLACPEFPSLNNMELRLQKDDQFLRYSTSSKMIQSEWTIHDLIRNLPNLQNLEISNHTLDPQCLTRNIYQEIGSLYRPEHYTIHLNSACTQIRFSKFANFIHHYLNVELPTLKLLSHSLPDCVQWSEMLQKCKDLSGLLQQFQKILEDLQSFYDSFSDIDELCYVVLPSKPTTKDNFRIFMLRECVFLKLCIKDPFAPIASMSVHILGPTYEVEKLRRTYSDGLREWDAELTIQSNLLRIFDLCFFPMPPGSGGNEDSDVTKSFCNICFCYEFEGQIPIVSCDNANCTLIFHAICLKEWFNTLSEGKTFLKVSFGVCPFCKAKLSTSFAELLEN